MGRAIDMEKDIDALKVQVKKLEDIVRGMTHNMDSMSEKSSKTKHAEEKKNGKKKANNKGAAQADSDSSKSNGNSKSKNNKPGNSGS